MSHVASVVENGKTLYNDNPLIHVSAQIVGPSLRTDLVNATILFKVVNNHDSRLVLQISKVASSLLGGVCAATFNIPQDWFSVSQVAVSISSALVVGIPSFTQIGAVSLGARPTYNIVSDVVAVLPSGDLSSQQIFRAPVFGKADALIKASTWRNMRKDR